MCGWFLGFLWFDAIGFWIWVSWFVFGLVICLLLCEFSCVCVLRLGFGIGGIAV